MNELLLKNIYPVSFMANRIKYGIELDNAMSRYKINTLNRKRSFLAQLGHECAQLSTFNENLNYSASALRSIFGKYFPNDAIALRYSHKPMSIANRIYANRMGNGNEQSGDGWKYRGRGGIQITFKDNYKDATEKMDLGVNFVLEPELLSTPKFAITSAAWWWFNNGLNELADKLGGSEDTAIFIKITRRVNGGENGLNDRLDIYKRTKIFIV